MNARTDRPNIILVVLDTLRKDELEYVTSQISDSAIARIADEGVVFENAYADAPWTLPSHASMFTGERPHVHGAHAQHKFLSEENTIARALAESGYTTAAFTNNAWVTDEFGFGTGFETLRKTWQYVDVGADFGKVKLTTEGTETILETIKSLPQRNVVGNVLNLLYGRFFYRRNDYGAARTNELIDEWLSSVASPFFTFVNYLEPHLDYQHHEEHTAQFLPEWGSVEDALAVPQDPWGYITGNLELDAEELSLLRSLYRGEISYIDAKIGDLRTRLETNDCWDDSVVIITGDHGENIGEHELMDHQYSLNNTLLHVPLVIGGGAIEQSESVTEYVQLHDLYQTIADLAGVDSVAETSSRNVFEADREFVIGEYQGGQPSLDTLRREYESLPDDTRPFTRALKSIQDRQYKLVIGSDGNCWLYDVTSDRGELKDISEECPEVVKRYRDALEEHTGGWDNDTSTGEAPEMDDATKSHLESLGYLQG